MNEEIDVSGCKYYRKNKECDIWGIPCQMKEFCYFKILKKENAKLKESNENLLRRLSTKMLSDEHYDIRSLEIENLGLAEENTKLKEKLNDIENILIKCTNAGCKECECTGICEEYLLKIIRGEE